LFRRPFHHNLLAALEPTHITDEESLMTKLPEHSIKAHRYELVHEDDADFIVYQRDRGAGVWQTISTWMIPRRVYLADSETARRR
jgi:hypothetical protein